MHLNSINDDVYLCERHFSDDGEHNLFAFCRIRILLVLIEPRLERIRALPRRVLAPDTVGHVVVRAVSMELNVTKGQNMCFTHGYCAPKAEP